MTQTLNVYPNKTQTEEEKKVSKTKREVTAKESKIDNARHTNIYKNI